MSGLSPLSSADSWQPVTGLQGPGSTQAPPEAANSANDSFAALLAQTLDKQAQAQTTGQASSPSAMSTSASGQSSVTADLSTLGQALASGNIAAAQQAFQALQSDIQSTQPADGTQQALHHHQQHAGSTANQASRGTGTSPGTAGDLAGASTATPVSGASQSAANDLFTASPQSSAANSAQMLSQLMGSM
jgi:hypothetical protein